MTTVYCLFDQMNAALVNIKYFFKIKNVKNLTNLKHLNGK